jgi:hypothetical protein
MDIVIGCLGNSLKENSTDLEFSTRIKNAWEVFDKYYSKTEDSVLYAAALILHPEHRIAYIRANWKPKWWKPVVKKVKDLWINYREQGPSNQLPLSLSSSPSQDLDEFDRVKKSLKAYRPTSQDEYDDYSQGETYDIKGSALQWWCQDIQRKCWPRLSYMAIDILSIPAMSAEPERVFSGARRTISWERSRLGAETVEQTECLKHWIQSGLVDKQI